MFNIVSDSLLEKVLCSISEPVLIINKTLEVVWTNPAAELFFGHSTEYITGKKCSSFLHCSMECQKNCPIRKAFETGDDELLIADGLVYPTKLLEVFSYKIESETFKLAIIHAIPPIDKHKTLRRDFAARLNLSASINDAAEDIVGIMQNFTDEQSCGLYVKKNDQFELLAGVRVPSRIPDVSDKFDLSKPLYLSSDKLPIFQTFSFEEGVAIIPVVSSKNKVTLLLFVGRGNLSTECRTRLEMMASVLESCLTRLTSSL